jgi:hypothetical protein
MKKGSTDDEKSRHELEEKEYQTKQEEWIEIENDVINYQKQFAENATQDEIRIGKEAACKLIEKFYPLLKKYILLFKTGQINFQDSDIKTFVGTFINNPRLHIALKKKKSKSEYKAEIYKRFGFVIETYGQLPENEMLVDLQMLLLILAKRYKQVGKNFCAYVHNCFKFEVSRYIKKYIENPINISYKNVSYKDSDNGSDDKSLDTFYEDLYYEPENGVPDSLWTTGKTCSEIFNNLTPLERKILVEYYAEELNDKQIAETLGLHINTVNQKRRQITYKLAETLNMDLNQIRRNRHSGRKN